MHEGYVYILTNRAMPGLVKIGMTTRSTDQRATELWQTGVPTPFDVAFSVLSPDPRRLEQMCHAALSGVRVDDAREFFAATPDEAKRVLCEHEDEVFNDWLTRFRPGYVVVEAGCFVDPSSIHIIANQLEVEVEHVADALSCVDAPRIADLVAASLRRSAGGRTHG